MAAAAVALAAVVGVSAEALAGSAATIPDDAERLQHVAGTPASPEERGEAFWHDDALPPASAEQRASKQAVAEGRSVEVTALTNETNRVVANSDGTFTLESSPVVERVRKGGRWVAVDTTLAKRPDGRFAPQAAQDVVLSGGGAESPLVTIAREGVSYELGAPWPLPEPRIVGSLAVYESVRPDVDLVVQIRPDGFTQNLVVHTREAAVDPGLKSIKFPITARGLTVETSEDGSVSFVDGAHRPVFSSSAALMWDSSSAPAAGPTSRTASATAVAEAGGKENPVLPEERARTAVAEVSIADQVLAVAPDQAFLTAPETSYPVVIDPPSASATLTGWTTVWSNAQSTSFWKTSHALGVGYDAYVDNKKARSLFQFDTRRVAGKKILGATFTAYEIWSANCTPQDVTLYRTSGISSSTTWSSPINWWHAATVSAAKGHSASCPDGDVEFNATSAVRHTANAKASTTTLGLRADEVNPIAWKQFMSPADDRATSSRKPRLSITYVSIPDDAPSFVKLADPNVACSSASNPAVIRDTTPRLTATPTSDDGSNASLRPVFDVYNHTDNVKLAALRPSTWTASGTAGSSTTAALVSGKTYRFTAATEYRYVYGGTTYYMHGPASASCYFKVDATAPPAPTVTSTAYPECAGTTCSSSPEAGGVGVPGAFTIAAGASDVRRYDIWLNGTLVESKKFTANTATHTLSVVPTKRLTNTLRVQTFDAAGNASPTIDYLFNVARGSDPVGEWPLDEGAGTNAADTGTGNHPLTLNQASWTERARLNAGLKGAVGTTYATSGTAVLDTTKSFSVAAWVKLDSKAIQTTVLQQRGTQAGAFYLYYSPSYDRWIFNRYAADATQTTIARAISTRAPRLGAWTHLTGVYDAQAKKIRLYVNGALEGEADFTTPWASQGALEVGRFTTASELFGDIDQVQAWSRAVFPSELGAVANAEDPATGLPRPALLAQWTMDEPESARTATDASGRGNHLNLGGGSTFATTSDYGHGSVLLLDQTVISHATSNAVVDANGSFTLAGWVNLGHYSTLEDTTIAHSPTVFALPGAQRDSLRLWYRQEAGQTTGTWSFGLFPTDTPGETGAVVSSDTVNAPTGWVHVAAVYDASLQSMKLYLAGDRQGDENGIRSRGAFQTINPLHVGQGRRHDTGEMGNHMDGTVDDLRVYAGVLSHNEILALALTDEPPVDIG